MEDELQQLKHSMRLMRDQLELATAEISDYGFREAEFKKTENDLRQELRQKNEELRKKNRVLEVSVENIPVVDEASIPSVSFDKELVEQLQKEVESLTEEVERLEKEKTELLNSQTEQANGIAELHQQITLLVAECESKDTQLAEVNADRDYLKQRYLESCKKIEVLNGEIRELSVPVSGPVAHQGNNMFAELDTQRLAAEKELQEMAQQLNDMRSQNAMLQSKLRVFASTARNDFTSVNELDHYKNQYKKQHERCERLEEQLSLLREQTNVIHVDDENGKLKLVELKNDEIKLLQREITELQSQLCTAQFAENERLTLKTDNASLRRELDIAKEQLTVFEHGEAPTKRIKTCSKVPPTPTLNKAIHKSDIKVNMLFAGRESLNPISAKHVRELIRRRQDLTPQV